MRFSALRRIHQQGCAIQMQPATTYIVSVFEKPHWRTVLVTKDKAKAEAMVEEIGGKVRIEEITPKPKRR
ncbi:hypothetical protein IQ26_03809 [Mesorhizobium tianshanense]|uniref:Uncharacterized protein n=2 Tax=Mesorhizobium tianshanense TaxID=39844 RepID=A0A562NPV5_9HYPH|nr:hypothetical protein IQ26_03809 [Mesorhizobium tianshanense]